MCAFLGIFHLLTTWFLQSYTIYSPYGSFMERIAKVEISGQNLCDFLSILLVSVKHSPTVVLFNIILFGGILLFTDTYAGKHKWNYIAGAGHAILQLANLYWWIWVFSRWNLHCLEFPVENMRQMLLFAGEMVIVGGIASGLIFGVYLLVSALVFQSHPTEASSSFRHDGYKNFLRMRLTKDRLTIYPIGLKNVVRDWKNVGTDEEPKFEGSPIVFSLIEKEPIEIKNI